MLVPVPREKHMIPALAAHLTPEQRRALDKELTDALWRAGDLEWKLDATQVRVRRAREAAWAPPPAIPAGVVLTTREKIQRAASPITFYELLARGNGKSFELVCFALETALLTPNRRILYCAPLREDAEKIVRDLLELVILTDCPDDVKPTWRPGDGEYHFKNGSIIRFRGVNNESDDRLRGAGYHLVILDEIGVYDRLGKTLGIVKPIAKRLKGRIVLATTPSEQEDHESTSLYEEHATAFKWRPPSAIKLTMLDNPRWAWEERVQILLDCGESVDDVESILASRMPPKRTETLREYWCDFVTDEARARFPEWRACESRLVVTAPTRPDYFYAYTILDLGFIDRTGGLYAFHDYENDVIQVEDESLLERPSSREIADEVQGKELVLWDKARVPPSGHLITRVMDAAPFILADLRREHRLDFKAPDKSRVESKQSYVQGANNYVNLLITGERVRVNARCTNLIRQLRNAVWDKNRGDFERDTRKGPASMGHYDLAAAFVYLCRAVNRRRNPFPTDYRVKRDGPNTSRRAAPKRTGLIMPTEYGRKLANATRVR